MEPETNETDCHICQNIDINEKNGVRAYNPHANLKQCKVEGKATEDQMKIILDPSEELLPKEIRKQRNESSIVKIFSLEKKDSPYIVGSGCLLSIEGKVVILSCAHNFCIMTHGANEKKPAYVLGSFFKIWVGDIETKIKLQKFYIHPKYVNKDELYDGYDFAIGIFDQSKLPKGYKPLEWSKNDLKKGGSLEVDVVGFPSEYKKIQCGMSGQASIEKNNRTQCLLITYSNTKIYTSEGQSGCPVVDVKDKQKVIGVHVGKDSSLDQNVATKLNPSLLLWVLRSVLGMDEQVFKDVYHFQIPPKEPEDQIHKNQCNLAKIAAFCLSDGVKYPVNLLEFCPFSQKLLKKAASLCRSEIWEKITNDTIIPNLNSQFVLGKLVRELINVRCGMVFEDDIKEISKNRGELLKEILAEKTLSECIKKGQKFYTFDRMFIQFFFLQKIEEMLKGIKSKEEADIDVRKQLSESYKDHDKVKKKLIELVSQKITISDNIIKIEKKDGYFVELFDWCRTISRGSFATSVVNELFRCEISNLLLNSLYEENAWNVFWDNYYEKTLLIDASPELHEKVVGRQPKQQSGINSLSSNYIWKFGLKGNEAMAYFMNSSGEGRHTHNYDDPSPSELINFRRLRYLFYAMRKGTPSLVVLDKSLEENYFYLDVKFDTLCDESKRFNWALELNSDELISKIDFDGFNYLRLYCNQFAENLKEFNGYIRNPNDKRMHLAFGHYSLVNLVKYYTFHNKDPQNDTSCQLNFTCVTQFGSRSKKTVSYDTIRCKVSTKYDPDMYMARNDRDQKSSYMGNNTSGGELVVIKLLEKLAPNVFEAKISVHHYGSEYCLFIDADGNLMWSQDRMPEKQSRFEVCIEGDEYRGGE